MGKVENFMPPTCVAYEGEALRLVTRLSKVALHMANIAKSIPTEARAEFEEAREILNEVIAMMSAIDVTYERLQEGAEAIIDNLADGETSGFVTKGSEAYMITGFLSRRKRTICIVLVALNDNKSRSSKAFSKAKNNILLLKNLDPAGLTNKATSVRAIVA